MNPLPADDALAAFWRDERVAVLATLIRAAHGDWDAAEDALADATARAVEGWTSGGVPERPGAWMLTVARRILVDRARTRKSAKRNGDSVDAHASVPSADDAEGESEPLDMHQALAEVTGDERLALLYTCCHPALSRPAQITLALRTIGGLTVREIARALLEPEATTAQRLVRTRRKIRDARIPFRIPAGSISERTETVQETLYLIFNEGYGSTEGDAYLRDGLTEEAIRLARLVVVQTPDDPESLGLLALMLLHHARAAARIDGTGAIVPLEQQDRAHWNRTRIQEGEHLLDRAMSMHRPGPYQLQAAIAALHATAASAGETDWRQIAALYGALRFMMPTPVVELNAAVALAMVHGPEWGLAQLDTLASERGMADYHLLPAARADLLRRAGRNAEAAIAYAGALALARSAPERRYLQRRLAETSCRIVTAEPEGAHRRATVL